MVDVSDQTVRQESNVSVPSTSRLQPGMERSASEDTVADPSYDPDKDLSENIDLKLKQFVEEWVLQLDRDDMIGLSLFFCFHLEKLFNFTQTNAAEYASIMLGKSEHTIRQWRTDFTAESEQG